jgi:hemerythrin-like metal-binding protein
MKAAPINYTRPELVGIAVDGGIGMAFLDWNDKYSVGVKKIDDQHRHLFKLTNDFHEALAVGTAQRDLGKALEALVDYTRFNFADEEALMDEADFPELAQHRLVHERLTREARDFYIRFVEGRPVSTLDFAIFLSDWLVNHIIVMDKDIGIHLKSSRERRGGPF